MVIYIKSINYFFSAILVFAAATIDRQQFRFLSLKQFGKQFPTRYYSNNVLHNRRFKDICNNL